MTKPAWTEEAEVIGRRIRSLREAQEMTQLALGKKIGSVSKSGKAKSRSAIAQWENGHAQPSTVEFKELARIFQTTPQYIAFGVEGKKNTDKYQVPVVDFYGANDWSAHSSVAIDQAFLDRCRIGGKSQLVAFDIPIEQRHINIDGLSPGDRLFIDTTNKMIDGNGEALVIWDGTAAILVHISLIPGSSKVAVRHGRNISEHSRAIQVIGRVIAFMGTLN